MEKGNMNLKESKKYRGGLGGKKGGGNDVIIASK